MSYCYWRTFRTERRNEMLPHISWRSPCDYSVGGENVARRSLYSTAALCIADCALAPNVVSSFISRGATTRNGAGALY
jgi:hypothetical protein